VSIPKNHHYVSQCHQREFFNKETGYIYVYDKEKKNFYRKETTKTLFSKDYLNSKENSGDLDHITLERELKILFEDDFDKFVNLVKAFVVEPINLPEMYEILGRFTLMGTLGQLRNPLFKKQLTELTRRMETDVLNMSTGFDKDMISTFLTAKLKTPYDNRIGYIDTALRILERMEPMEYELFSIESDVHFILPDTSCYQVRGQLRPYPNTPIQEITRIGMPLTDKIFLLASSSLLKGNRNGIQSILEEHAALAMEININLFHFAYTAVACKDENYLRTVVEASLQEKPSFL
jgi:hypothetical protein